jgi:hypothetical protein
MDGNKVWVLHSVIKSGAIYQEPRLVSGMTAQHGVALLVLPTGPPAVLEVRTWAVETWIDPGVVVAPLALATWIGTWEVVTWIGIWAVAATETRTGVPTTIVHACVVIVHACVMIVATVIVVACANAVPTVIVDACVNAVPTVIVDACVDAVPTVIAHTCVGIACASLPVFHGRYTLPVPCTSPASDPAARRLNLSSIQRLLHTPV